MTQIPQVPICPCPQCCNRGGGSYNGVKIDITNPTVNIPPAPITAPIYDIPQASIYDVNTPAPQVEELPADTKNNV